MSVKALSAVFEDSRATDSAFVVLLAMADWADQNGRCYPSYGQIAKKARVSRATAIAAIRDLVTLGELERVAQGQAPTAEDEEAPAKVRSQWRNLYRIVLVKSRAQVVQPSDSIAAPLSPPQVVERLDPLPTEVVQPARAGGLTDTAQVVNLTDPHIRNRPSVEPSVEPSEERARGATRPTHHRHAFCPPHGDGFCVPEFLHNELRTMLGAHEPEFDLLTWYVSMDLQRRKDQPTVGDPLGWWRGELRAAMQFRGWLVPRGVLRDRRADATVVSGSTCQHPTRCASVSACIERTVREGRAARAAGAVS